MIKKTLRRRGEDVRGTGADEGPERSRHGRGNYWMFVGVSVAAALLPGCVSRGGSVPYDPAGFTAPDAEGIQLTSAQQRIGPLDELHINVFRVPDLSGDFTVDASGYLNFPLLGSVQAQGKSTEDLAREIESRLEQNYVRSPSVQVSLTEAKPQTITVEGSVRDPGAFPIESETTLLRAVALADGTSEDANPARVAVFRTIGGQRQAAAFDLRAIRRGEAADPLIYGNDIIVVAGSRSRSIFKDIVSVIPAIGIFAAYSGGSVEQPASPNN